MVGKKLLVADDSLTIQKVIRLALSNEGYEIQTVSDGNDAVQQISVFRPDVILIDVSLPGKSAFEVKREISGYQDLAFVKFILMSSAFEKIDEAQAAEIGFDGRLTKPFDPAHLRQVIVDVMKIDIMKTTPPPLPQRPAFVSPSPPPPPISVPPIVPPTPTFSFQKSELPESDLSSITLPGVFPDDPPPLGNDLWDHEADINVLSAVPASPPPAPEPDLDIKHLTESTIRMSGLDDFQWNIQEPTLKPPAAMLDTEGTTFKIDDSSIGLNFSADLPDGFSTDLSDSLANNLTADLPSDFSTSINDPQHKSMTAAQTSNQSQLYAMPPLQPTNEAIEEIVRKQVQESIEKIAKTILPEVAERVIKQEIHRMLSEQP